MVVHTTNTDVVKTQQGMLEFLLINHPLDCPICDKGGECPLQNLTFKYGPGKSRYTEEKRHFVKHLPIGPQIVLDRERCIVCQLCVRFMEDVADDPQIVLMSRGGKTEVNVFPDRPFDSLFAGNTIELCPVGALTSRQVSLPGSALGSGAHAQRLPHLRGRLQRHAWIRGAASCCA